jgi:hypothetical protein
MHLTWKASESASALHAVHAMREGWPLATPGVGEALAHLVDVPVRANADRMTAVLLEQAAAGIEQNHQLAERALVKQYGGGSDTELSTLAAWVSAVERAYYDWYRGRSNAQLVDEIVTRTEPLRSLWDARGPGMLHEMGRLTEPSLLSDRAEVVMVLPVLGGHGTAHLPVNLVTLEAVLTNADESLPEIVRLAWLLGQLQFDLPMVSERLVSRRIAHLAQVAMLPPALAAAADVELAEFSEAQLAHAAVAWRVASTPDDALRIARASWQWWATYQNGRVAWPVAVAALEQMLAT